MEIDEIAARLVRQYWALVVVCMALPLLAIGALTVRHPPTYAASARIITGSIVPTGTAAADAIVSQVQAIATTRSAASQALRAAGVSRNLNSFITNHISVTGLGSSQVVDITVTDKNPAVAAAAAGALASAVTNSLNSVGQSGLVQALKAIDDQVLALTQERETQALKAEAGHPNPLLQAKLAGLDEVIANLTGDRGRLLAQASTEGRAAVIDNSALPTHPVSRALVQKLGLAAVLGLVVGVLVASLAETARPTVPGARRVSRRLGTALLGRLGLVDLSGARTPNLADLVLRLRLAARNAGVSTVALAGLGTEHTVGDLAGALDRLLSADGPAEPAAPSTNSQHASASADATMPLGVAGTTLLRSHYPAVERPALRVYPLAKISAATESGRIGLVVLAGPVSRVSDIAAVNDLIASSGWPLVGVVGIPRTRKPRPAVREVVAAVADSGSSQ